MDNFHLSTPIVTELCTACIFTEKLIVSNFDITVLSLRLHVSRHGCDTTIHHCILLASFIKEKENDHILFT